LNGKRFQRNCQNGGILVPTVALDNALSAAAANVGNKNNFESYCGTYLNPLALSQGGGIVTGPNYNL
jgi:hypothetical protein